MKLLISLLLLLPVQSQASVIVMSYSSEQLAHAEHMLKVMQDVHHIPGDFIELVASTSPCRPLRVKSSWHLCLNENGDLQEVAVDISFIQETLRVFL